MASGSVSKLLAQVEKNTNRYLEYFKSQNLPEPSYDQGDGLDPHGSLPSKIKAARDAAIEATDELHHLLLGPLGLILSAPGDHYLLLSLQCIYKYKIAHHVPIEGETTFIELSQVCGLNLSDLRRFLRVAIARHVFHEPKPESVVHTAASKLLVNNTMMQAWLLNIAEEFWPSLTRVMDANARWPASEEPNESGYSLSHQTNENPFDVIKKDPSRQQQFIDAMSYSHLHHSYSVNHLIDNFDFGGIGAGMIVDVGGSHGQVSIAIAKKYPDVECIVQDLPDTIVGLENHVPADIRSRVKGMEHDFLTPQPVHGADIYLLRWILHDWSDKYCIKILQCLVPALKKGARIVVNDICIPAPGQISISADRGLRIMDISMKAFNNARERDAETWASLFSRADPRFHLTDITIPNEARMAIILAEWRGSDHEHISVDRPPLRDAEDAGANGSSQSTVNGH